MKVRQLRKRKPVSQLALLQSHIRRSLLRILKRPGIRYNDSGLRAAESVVARHIRAHLERYGPPPGWALAS